MKSIKLAALLSLSIATSASVAATTWGVGDFLDGGNAATLQATSASAWSTSGNLPVGSLSAATLCNYGSAGYGIVTAAEGTCANAGVGPHAGDNYGSTDMFLLRFASAVSLTQVKIGWNGTDDWGADSDISVLAYTGNSNPAPVGGLTASQLLANNWQVIGNYTDVGASNGVASNSGGTATISTAVTSSWWLVSAYSTSFGGSYSTGNDYFKLLSVAGNVASSSSSSGGSSSGGGQVPEPGSVGLIGLALLGSLAVRRRRSF